MVISKAIIRLFFITLGFIIIFSTFDNSIIIDKNLTKKIRYIFPEGWGFFTKDPTEALVDVYKIDNKTKKLVELDLSNVSTTNHLGFSREARIKGYEMSMLLSKVPKNYWIKDSTLNILTHLNDRIVLIEPEKKFKYMVKGEYILKMRGPVPWSWSNRGQEKYTPFKILRIFVND